MFDKNLIEPDDAIQVETPAPNSETEVEEVSMYWLETNLVLVAYINEQTGR